jgi:hypothetical protein
MNECTCKPSSCIPATHSQHSMLMCRYWQCLPETNPAPAPHSSTGRRLQAATVPEKAPAPSSAALLPGPQPAPKPSLAANYSQCGGEGGSCPLANKALCTDAQYLECASADFHCMRQSKWYRLLPKVLGDINCFRRSKSCVCAHLMISISKVLVHMRAHISPYLLLICGTNVPQLFPSRSWACLYRYWQCVPVVGVKPEAPQPSKPAAQPPAAQALQPGSSVQIWSMCGGKGDPCPLTDRSQCADAQYLKCAPDTLQCVRQSQW